MGIFSLRSFKSKVYVANVAFVAMMGGCAADGTPSQSEDSAPLAENAAAVLDSVNGRPTITGLSTINGLATINGLSTINGLKTINGLSTINGLKTINGLSTINGLTVDCAAGTAGVSCTG